MNKWKLTLAASTLTVMLVTNPYGINEKQGEKNLANITPNETEQGTAGENQAAE